MDNETSGSEGTQSATGEEQRIRTNSTDTNDATRLKRKGHLEADMHRGERKVRCCTTHRTGTWNARSINKGRLETIKQEVENLNITMLGVSELKWTGTRLFSVKYLQSVPLWK